MKDIVLHFIDAAPQCGIRPREAHLWRPLDFSPDDRAFYVHRTFHHWGAVHATHDGHVGAITDGERVFAFTFDGRFIECVLGNLERRLIPIATTGFPAGHVDSEDTTGLTKSSRLRALYDSFL